MNKKQYILWIISITFLSIYFVRCGLLPPIAKSSEVPKNIVIQKAKVDPAFFSTRIRTLGILPFSNATKFDDAYILYNSLTSNFKQKHSKYKIISPKNLMEKISSAPTTCSINFSSSVALLSIHISAL